MLDGGRGDGPLPEADRHRARHRRVPMMIDSLEVGGHRGRPASACRARPIVNSISHEGGRGRRSCGRPGCAASTAPPSSSWPSTRRARPTTCERHDRDLRARLPHPGRRGRLPARGHHLRPQHLRRRHRHRGARQLRARLHRGDPLDQGRTCPAPRSPAASRNVSFSLPRQQPGARGDPHRLPVPRDPGRPGHGHRQRRRRSPSTTRSTPELRERVEDVVLNRRAGRHRAAARDRRARSTAGRGRSEAPTSAWRALPGRRAASRTPWSRASTRFVDRRHRGAARRDRRPRRPPDRRHRGPADGRHERRRRPVRRRQDVPARRWSRPRA